jgi:hypothetical protein
MLTDTNHAVTGPEDLYATKKITWDIIREICWKAHLGFADELLLEIGQPLYSTKAKEAKKGVWRLSSCGTGWKLYTAIRTIVTSEDEPGVIASQIQVLEHLKIISFDITYPELGLKVTFEKGYTLEICPTPKDAKFDMAYWQLYCPPDYMILELGPGKQWRYTRSGLPVKDW